MTTATIDRIRPSYGSLIARSRGQSQFPQMWDGLIGEYVPALGSTGGTVFDLSEYKRHGTTSGIDTNSDWVASSNPRLGGWSLNFDGDQDYISIPWTFSLDVYSCVAWVKINAGTVIQAIYDARDANNDGTVFAIDGSEQIFCTYNATSLTANTVLADGEWHHIAVTSDGSILTAYVNGANDGETSISGSISVTTDLKIGARNFSTPTVLEWAGEMQEVRFYERALTAEEVLHDYNNPLSLLRMKRFVSMAPETAAAGSAPMMTMLGVG